MAKKTRVPAKLRQQVRERAKGCCEYCLVHEDDLLFPCEADHVIAEQHKGATVFENLAWACGICNRNKGPNIMDPGIWTAREA
jgi:5-methylcytosine-specific restriction endonuclease McrA